MSDRDNLDQLLDAALSTYADPGADSGLEARLLARMDAVRESGRQRRRFLWAAGALAAAACMVLLIAPWRSAAPRIEARSERPEAVAAVKTSVPHPSRPATLRLHKAGAVLSAHNSPPKLEVFPKPAGLTGEEQALVHFALHSSEAQHENLVADEQRAEAPIDIAAIAIPPIEPPSPGKE
jgi:hypothetical protein